MNIFLNDSMVEQKLLNKIIRMLLNWIVDLNGMCLNGNVNDCLKTWMPMWNEMCKWVRRDWKCAYKKKTGSYF